MFGRDAGHLIHQLGEKTLEPVDLLVMVLSCQKTIDRQEACRETWMAHGIPDGVKVVFLVGRPGQQPALCGDVLFLDCPDTYLALPQKTWSGIRESLLRWNASWYLKIDDDTLCNLPRAKNYLRSNDYMGRKVATNGTFDPNWEAGKCLYTKHDPMKVGPQRYPLGFDHTPFIAPWAGGGAGYFLSRRAAQLVAREPRSHVDIEKYEDKFCGDVMASYGIYIHGRHDSLRALPQTDGHLRNLNGIYGATTIHQLPPDMMRRCYHRLLRMGEFGT